MDKLQFNHTRKSAGDHNTMHAPDKVYLSGSPVRLSTLFDSLGSGNDSCSGGNPVHTCESCRQLAAVGEVLSTAFIPNTNCWRDGTRSEPWPGLGRVPPSIISLSFIHSC